MFNPTICVREPSRLLPFGFQDRAFLAAWTPILDCSALGIVACSQSVLGRIVYSVSIVQFSCLLVRYSNIFTRSNMFSTVAGGMAAAALFSTNTKPLLAAASRSCVAA